MNMICIGRDFSDTPIGRYYPADGPRSGQKFRDDYLIPALKDGQSVSVRIDDVEGYGSSFLDEAFGGLVRVGGFSEMDLKNRLEIVSEKKNFEKYRDVIWLYIKQAQSRKQS